MGAIAGVMPRRVSLDRDSLTSVLVGVRDAMRRRAPIVGGMAIAYDASIGLAHRAGEGPGGESVLQPLTNETGSLWLVADGEPSNAADLRLELIGAGHRFRSACGSEVILHLYEQEGPGAIERLAGAFAFALWDRDQRLLLLGRDRSGEKPLYVADGGGCLRFASEAQALTADAPLEAAGAAAFLTLGYVPPALTMASPIRAVEPGTALRVRGDRDRVQRFCERPWIEPTGEPRADRLSMGRALREAVETAMAGEEDVGVVLDGELAGAALLAVVRPMLGRGLSTHTLVFESGAPSRNRRWRRWGATAHTRALADWFGSEHHEHHVGPAEMAAAFEAASDGDHPSVGGALAHLTAAFVAASGDRVLLSALGGSELLGPAGEWWRPWVWRAGRHRSTRAAARAGARLATRFRPFGTAAALAGVLEGDDAVTAAYLGARGVFAPSTLAHVLRPEALHEARSVFDPVAYLRALALTPAGPRGVGVVAASARSAALRTVAAIERRGLLLSGAVRDVEDASAALGLALRAPYLDHRLVEWADALHTRARGASALGEILRAMIPPRLRAAHVRAAQPPLGRWMRQEMRSLIEGYLLADDPEGMFSMAGIEALWRGFLAGAAPAHAVWTLAVLRAWIAARRARLAQGAGGQLTYRRDAA